MVEHLTLYGPIYYVETHDDAAIFMEWMAGRSVVSVDIEATGLDIFSPGFAVRLVQFGSTDAAYVLDAVRFAGTIRRALAGGHSLIFHNATYDVLALDRVGLARLDDLYARATDTRVMAHLIDPRSKQDGGLGHGLKALAAHYVDAGAPDGEAELRRLFAINRWTWATVPADHPTFVMYAGLDVLLTSRLADRLRPLVATAGGDRLLAFELDLQAACARMQRRGLLLDVPYAVNLAGYLDQLAEEGRQVAADFGVPNVNSTRQVAAALEALGAELVERTKTGPKVDKRVLEAVAEHGPDDAATLARAIIHAKQAGKWRATYVEPCLAARDGTDRVHPSINSLQARTGRMSIEHPPLQQLPARDWRIRRMFIADPGMAIVSVDYSQVELRVLAALADERGMIDAVNSGTDLHDATAARMFGPGFTKSQRRLAKNVGFGRVYGGGADTLARQAGVTLEAARRAIRAYDTIYPGIRRFADRLTRQARIAGKVTTPTGRHIPVDHDRAYAALNYVVQSTSRDVLAAAILDLERAGFGDCLLLPIHDEILAQAPAAEAVDVARGIADVMTTEFGGLRLVAEPEVYGPSWGHGYGAT
jgi:DNA polymerase-1